MLQHLTIRDFVLVDHLELDFVTGFGALTGETGAGKSILVDALAFALGERADSGVIRAECERVEVSAEFDVQAMPEIIVWLREHDLDGGDSLLLRRILDRSGRSRAYLNGSPITVQQLREVAESLVDIHGQHAHQSLLRSEAQRTLLDTHAGAKQLADEVSTLWRRWHDTTAQLEAARAGIESVAREREQLDWQVRELETLAFTASEWEALNIEHRRLANAARLADGARFSLDALTEGEAACEGQIDTIVGRLDDLVEYDPVLEETAALMRSAQAELSEAVSALRRYIDRVDLDPQRLTEIEARIDAVLGCARKYRSTPDALPALLASWQQRLAELNESADIGVLQAKVAATRQAYITAARKLSKQRSATAQTLGQQVSQVMQQLALGGGRFEIALVPVENGAAYGLEQVEFRVAGLAGNESRPLAKVVSGGELSRISLAIQVVTSQSAHVPTLIFDEVDVGIGGGVAEVVGRLLRELGTGRQVLCVTHLPQVAACANWQWQVSKSLDNGTARSHVVALDDDARVLEIARMLGGVEITELTRQHAAEMLAR